MTLTIELPREAELQLEAEAKRTGVSVPQLAGRLLVERLKTTTDRIDRLIADIGAPIDLADTSRGAMYAE